MILAQPLRRRLRGSCTTLKLEFPCHHNQASASPQAYFLSPGWRWNLYWVPEPNAHSSSQVRPGRVPGFTSLTSLDPIAVAVREQTSH